jgi:hypothetical protein
MHRTGALLGAIVILSLVLTGCGQSVSSATNPPPKVLAEASGICPNHVIYGKTPPPACISARDWNGSSPIFKTPHRQWGVAYAFNCGSRAQDFSVDARLPGMDHMRIPGPQSHAVHGSGYAVFTKRQMTDLLAGVPPDFAVDGHEMQLMVATACTWHVKAILGAKGDVAAAVPPIPAVRSPWWK